MSVLCITKGELWLRDGAGPGQELRSPFAKEVIERDASDLHATVGERPMLRIDWHIIPARTSQVLSGKDTLQLAYSVLTEGQKKRFELDDELDFSFGIASVPMIGMAVGALRITRARRIAKSVEQLAAGKK